MPPKSTRSISRRVAAGVALVGCLLALPWPARADETDNFTCRLRTLREAQPALDAWVNARILEAVARANRRGAAACDAGCLARELQRSVGANVRHRVTLIPHSQFAMWIARQPAVDRCHVKFSDSIYGARPYNQPWLFPFTGRIIFVADSIRLSGRVVGLDKINHFMREGLAHWRATRRGDGIATVMQHELGAPRRQWRWNEHGLKGLSLTGAVAYADLAASYSGFTFWYDVLSTGEPGSFVAYDPGSGRFVQRRLFHFDDYVTDAWDEAINVSRFDGTLAKEVSAALVRRSLATPIADCRPLAALPRAELYVNPSCLAP